jgi:hypothetical protein
MMGACLVGTGRRFERDMIAVSMILEYAMPTSALSNVFNAGLLKRWIELNCTYPSGVGIVSRSFCCLDCMLGTFLSGLCPRKGDLNSLCGHIG